MTSRARTMANIHYRLVRDFMVVVHTTKSPVDAEWDLYLASLAHPGLRGVLAWTAGGAPTGEQRSKMMKVYRRDLPVAVVTDVALTRAILAVTSLLFLTNARAFPLGQEDDAISFFHVTENERAAMHQTLKELRAQAAL